MPSGARIVLEPAVTTRAWQRILAREWLLALVCFVAIIALCLVDIKYARGGLRDGYYSPTGPNWWASFDNLFSPCGISGDGYFWYWVFGLYGTLQFVRFTVWAVRVARS